MSRAFLSPSRCEPGTLTSPLRRALDGVDPEAVRDLSLEGIVEIRGDLDVVAPAADEELVQLSPRRGYLFTDDDPADVVERLRVGGVLAYDATGALAGLAIASEQVMRRLTDLDLDHVPAAGPFAHVTAIVRCDEDGWFSVYVQQELGHYVAEAVIDALVGLGQTKAGVWPDTSRLPGSELQPDVEGHALPRGQTPDVPDSDKGDA